MATGLDTAEVEIALVASEREVTVTASLSVPGVVFSADAKAPVSRRLPDPILARDLAIARVLRNLENEVMQSVHERIDRFTGN